MKTIENFCEVCNSQREWQLQRKRWFKPREYKCQTCGVITDEFDLIAMDREGLSFEDLISREATLVQNPTTKHLRMIVPRNDGRSDVYSYNFERRVFEYSTTLPGREE